jgi:hypothetical protein
MTKLTLMSAALIAATAFAAQAMAAGNHVAARHATTKAHTSATDCVRAPNSARLPRMPILYRRACLTPLLIGSNSDGESGWQASPARLCSESTPVDAQIVFGRTAAVHVAFVHR